ncbi:MAG TPA: hypothetical protein VD905_21470 [Flavobacteriales bacterium]|nr:hypothetical protein [Flavobacteriales bacterium]
MKVLVLFIANFYFAPVDCTMFFGENYTLAVKQAEKDATLVADVARTYDVDPVMVQSIVFPEYIRHNALGALMEESALEILYVDMGTDAVDFSIGRFQIKPSFASAIETHTQEDPVLARKYAALYLGTRPVKEQRRERIKRLKDVGWQTRYVCAFIEYCEKYYGLGVIPADEKIKFLSTAYNAGIQKEKGRVEANYSIKAFPYGPKFKIEQVSYWAVSLDYFHAKEKSK